MKQKFRIPLKQEVKDRKELFAELNEFVRARHGWLTSIAGAINVTLECLPASRLPHELLKLGYDVREIGAGQRIVPTAITEQSAIDTDGELSPLTEASTRLVQRPCTTPGSWRRSGTPSRCREALAA